MMGMTGERIKGMGINGVVHVGFSKTGTTTLQKHLFAKHKEIKFPGKPYGDEVFKDLIHELIMKESIAYDASKLKTYIGESGLLDLREGKKVWVVSDEMFVSYSKVRDKGMVAHRVRDVFGDCKILITIRNQGDLLRSAYLSRGRYLSDVPRRFLGLGVSYEDWIALSLTNYERGYINHGDYYKTVVYYSRLFGKENICVLMLEEFIHDREKYMEKLSGFLGVDKQEALECVKNAHEHKDMTGEELDYELIRSVFFPLHNTVLFKGISKAASKWKHRKDKSSEAQVDLSPEIRERLDEIFRPGNRELVKEFGLPLEKYGYPL